MCQYKVIHNILPNKDSLFRAGIAKNDTCLLRNIENQTSSHMLNSCFKTITFWARGIKSSSKAQLSMNTQSCMAGTKMT